MRSLKILILTIMILSTTLSTVGARTVDEISSEIEQKESELSDLEAQLKEKEKALANATINTNSAKGELDHVIKEIEQSTIELELLTLEYQELDETYKLKLLQVEREEEKQQKQLSALYMSWKGNDELTNVLVLNEDPLKFSYYQEIIAETDQGDLNASYSHLTTLKEDLDGLEEKRAEMEDKSKELEDRKASLEAQIAQLKSQESTYAQGVKQLRPKVNATQEELNMLSAEQKSLQDVESRLIGGDTKGGTEPLVTGEYYFTGIGRDLYQGHGVGLSQFGAYGAARSGWSAQQILTHYYQGVNIAQGTGTVNVIGPTHYRQNLDVEIYAAGAGEVPNRACGTAQQAADRPDKYIVDNPSTVWDCWPEEAIKAQIIAYRTYGLRNVNVYDNASSQVYTGTTLKQWAADETRGQVIYYNGALISAVYSSDNNNGWGTADNDTVWSNYSGDGTPYPYLRATYDENIAYHYTWSTWRYRTNSYTMDQIKSMIDFVKSSGSVSSSARSFMSSVANDIGSLRSLEFVRDSSGRVKKVKLNGDRGSRYVAGWLYKSLWNIWVGTAAPSGEVDYIYSLTFTFSQV